MYPASFRPLLIQAHAQISPFSGIVIRAAQLKIFGKTDSGQDLSKSPTLKDDFVFRR
jgi:hypothetical protein